MTLSISLICSPMLGIAVANLLVMLVDAAAVEKDLAFSSSSLSIPLWCLIRIFVSIMLHRTCVSFHSLVVSYEGLARSKGILTVQPIGVLWFERLLFQIRNGRDDLYPFHLDLPHCGGQVG